MTEAAAAPSHPRRSYRYYDLVMAAFVTVLLCANVIGAAKVATLGGLAFGAGVLFFPISYIFGDILTEVYGYARARKVVWAGFAALAFASFMSWAVLALPPAPGWSDQAAYETVFASTPRIALASLVAYFSGEFCNSYVLARMKLLTSGRRLWSRTIGSTIVGEAVDSAVFYPLAFLGAWEVDLVLGVMLSNYLLKVLWEAVMTPLTYRIVGFLKRAEAEDYYDRDTDFTSLLRPPRACNSPPASVTNPACNATTCWKLVTGRSENVSDATIDVLEVSSLLIMGRSATTMTSVPSVRADSVISN